MDDFAIRDQFLENNREGFKAFLDEFYDTIQKAIRSVNKKNSQKTEDGLVHDVLILFRDKDNKIIRDWKGKGSLAGYIFIISKRLTIKIVDKEVQQNNNQVFFNPDTLPAKLQEETRIANKKEKEVLVQVMEKELKPEEYSFLRAVYWLKWDTNKLMKWFTISKRDLLYKRKYRLIQKLRKLVDKFKRGQK